MGGVKSDLSVSLSPFLNFLHTKCAQSWTKISALGATTNSLINLLFIVRDCHLTEPGYKRLVGSTTNSWGWCLKSMKLYHDNRKYREGVSYPIDIDGKLKVPTSFYMILDMDRGTLAFQVRGILR